MSDAIQISRVFSSSLVDQARNDNASLDRVMHPIDRQNPASAHVGVLGQGPPVVLVPMIQELNFVYVPLIVALQTHYTVVIYKPAVRYTRTLHVAERVDELRDILSHLNLGPIHLISWSDTGAVAYRYAHAFPADCLSVVFLGVPDRYRFALPIGAAMRLLLRWPLPRLIPAPVLRHVLALHMHGRVVKHRDVIAIARTIHDLSALFVHSCLPNMLEHKPASHMIIPPTHVLYGDHDVVVSALQAIAFANLMGDRSSSERIPFAEHMMPWSNADATTHAVSRFLANVIPQ